MYTKTPLIFRLSLIMRFYLTNNKNATLLCNQDTFKTITQSSVQTKITLHVYALTWRASCKNRF